MPTTAEREPTTTALAAPAAGDAGTTGAQVFAAFTAHFHRPPDLHNPHDLACVEQLDHFVRRYGRAPIEGDRNDLATLQQIEVASLCRKAAENPLLNRLETAIRDHPQALDHEKACPVIHRFSPGLYTREVFHPAGVVTVTKIHKTEHQFIISRGRAMVSHGQPQDAELRIAPYHGTTRPGTRRSILALEDMVLTTLHPTDKTDLAEIEDELIYAHDPGSPGKPKEINQ